MAPQVRREQRVVGVAVEARDRMYQREHPPGDLERREVTRHEQHALALGRGGLEQVQPLDPAGRQVRRVSPPAAGHLEDSQREGLVVAQGEVAPRRGIQLGEADPQVRLHHPAADAHQREGEPADRVGDLPLRRPWEAADEPEQAEPRPRVQVPGVRGVRFGRGLAHAPFLRPRRPGEKNQIIPRSAPGPSASARSATNRPRGCAGPCAPRSAPAQRPGHGRPTAARRGSGWWQSGCRR